MYEDNLIYKFDLTDDEVKKIVRDYGSISDFCQKYLAFIQGDRTIRIKIPKTVIPKLVNFFDLSNAYSIGENSGYAQLVADILKIRPGFVTYGSLEEIVNSAMDEALSEQDKDIVRALYNLDGKNRTIDELELKYRELSRNDILLRKQRSVKRIAVGRKNSQLQLLRELIVDSEIVADVLQEYLVQSDAVAENDYEQVNIRKIDIIEAILSREVENIRYTDDNSYIFQSFCVKNKIHKSILPDDKKSFLLASVDTTVHKIAEENAQAIIKGFEDRIANFKHDDNEARRYEALKKEIINAGLDENTISALLESLPDVVRLDPTSTVGLMKRDLLLRIQFPQYELSIESIALGDRCREAYRKIGLINIEKIVSYSRRELLSFPTIRGQFVDELFEKLEKIGYDIPEDESVSIESYNQDKIHEDSFSKMADDIADTEFDEASKSYLLDIVLKGSIEQLQKEYERLNRLIATYKDIFRTHQTARLETADEDRYRRKVKEAEVKKAQIKKRLDELENKESY